MRLSHLRIFSVLSLAVSASYVRVIDVGRSAAAFAVAFLDSVFAVAASPMELRQLFGLPQLSTEGFGGYIDPAMLNEQRHEAGMPRLGSVRHR